MPAIVEAIAKAVAWIILVLSARLTSDFIWVLLGMPSKSDEFFTWFRGAVIGMIIAKGVWSW